MLPASYFLVDSVVFRLEALHTTASAIFTQNIMLAWQGGTINTGHAILVHMWSLSVEEQFYLVIPFLLVVTPRTMFRYLLPALWIASFIVNICQMIPIDTSQNYVSTFGRAWQILTGSILAVWVADGMPYFVRVVKERVPASSLSTLGMVMIGYSVSYFTFSSSYPGYTGLLPVIGTALVITAGTNTSMAVRFLNCKIMQWIGLISYPLYLWAYALTGLMNNHYNARIYSVSLLVIPVSFFLSWLSTETIERYFRNNDNISFKVNLTLTWMITLSALGLTITLCQ